MKSRTLLTLFIFINLATAIYGQSKIKHTPASANFLVPYRIKDLWGFSDQYGNIVIKPMYSTVGKICFYWTDGKAFKSLMEVAKGNRKFVINHLNETIVPIEKEFDAFSFDSYSYETVIACKKGKKALYYDSKELLPALYDNIERMRNLSFKISKGNLNGLVNSKAELVVPQRFYFVFLEKTGDREVTWGASRGAKEGKETFSDKKVLDTLPTIHDMGSISLNSTLSLEGAGNMLNIDSAKNALSISYQDVKTDDYYPFLIHISKNGKKGLYNAITKKIIIPAEYELVKIDHGLNPEIIILVKNGTYGFFNDFGKMIVPPIIETIYDTRLPLTLVKGNLVGMLTETAHYIKPKYKKINYLTSIRDFKAGQVFTLYEVETMNGKKGFVSNSGTEYFKD
ncbi:WG repeat-containing protein [Pedobacter aquatilis]|uniref:WG repeat-containing protein n=1 Tax=Pedobacter aquatilis TaxID=351343 RepID=UPI00292E9DA9|nr:WG repeat-containing protein [Pedobacter aquatilis]